MSGGYARFRKPSAAHSLKKPVSRKWSPEEQFPEPGDNGEDRGAEARQNGY